METLWNILKCFLGLHDLVMVKPISRQALLVKCFRCGEQYAMKMEGDCRGCRIPWEKAKEFYTDELIAQYLND